MDKVVAGICINSWVFYVTTLAELNISSNVNKCLRIPPQIMVEEYRPSLELTDKTLSIFLSASHEKSLMEIRPNGGDTGPAGVLG